MSIIILRIVNFTVVLCVHVTVLRTFFQHKAIGHKSVLFHFQTQDSDMHVYMHTHVHQTMETETGKTINFWGCFIYNMVIIYIGWQSYSSIERFLLASFLEVD